MDKSRDIVMLIDGLRKWRLYYSSCVLCGKVTQSLELVKLLEESADALEHLMQKEHPLSHIMMMETASELGPYCMEEVVLVNANRISQEEAWRCVRAEEYNDNVLVIPKKQWLSLFQDKKE